MATQQPTFKLIALNRVRATIAQAVKMKQDATVSAMFYGMVVQDVSWATGMIRTDAADFDTVLRVLMPLKWNSKSNVYQFSNEKAMSAAKALDIDLVEMRKQFKEDKNARPAIVQAFYEACMKYYAENAQAKKDADLTADELAGKIIGRAKKVMTDAHNAHISLATMLDVMLTAGYDVPNEWLQSVIKAEKKAVEVSKAA